jgi:ferredoxin
VTAMNTCHRSWSGLRDDVLLAQEYRCSQWERCATCLAYLLRRSEARAEAAEMALEKRNVELENTTRILEAAERLFLEEGLVFSREP